MGCKKITEYDILLLVFGLLGGILLKKISCNSEEELVVAAQRGNKEALDRILLLYQGFIRYIAQKYFLKDGDHQDLLQEASIGLLEAIRAYDYKTKVKFRNFAFICIKRELDSVISRSNRKKRQVLNNAIPIYAYVEEENERYGSEYYSGDNYLKSDKETPEDEFIAREELNELIEFLKDGLTELELKVLYLRIQGRSYKEITDILHIQIKAVDNAIQRIRKKVNSSYKTEKSA